MTKELRRAREAKKAPPFSPAEKPARKKNPVAMEYRKSMRRKSIPKAPRRLETAAIFKSRGRPSGVTMVWILSVAAAFIGRPPEMWKMRKRKMRPDRKTRIFDVTS